MSCCFMKIKIKLYETTNNYFYAYIFVFRLLFF